MTITMDELYESGMDPDEIGEAIEAERERKREEERESRD
jgi:hypothetical protein